MLACHALTLRNSQRGYGLIARWLHWLTALCMLPALGIAAFVDTLDENTPGDPEIYFAWMPWHKTFGFFVLVLLVIRLPWMLGNPKPELPNAMTRWQKQSATLAHWTLYGLMVALPILGWLGTSVGQTSFKLFDRWPMPYLPTGKDQELSNWIYEWLHVPLGWFAMGLVAVHIGATLWHALYLRDGILTRMVFGAPADNSKAS